MRAVKLAISETSVGSFVAFAFLICGVERLAAEPPPSFTTISPIFSELVAFSLPAKFTTVFENANATNYIREAVLKGETTEKWSEMITITGAKGLAQNRKVTPESFAAGIAGGFKQACPDNFSVKVFGPERYADHDAFAAVASCGKVDASPDKHSETALIVAIKGRDDYYTIQWAERTPSSAENLTIDAAKWRDRLKKLEPINLCAVVPGEKPPYPSCLGTP